MAMQSYTINQLRKVMPMYWHSKKPLFIWGPSGSAKSTSVHLFADDMKKEFDGDFEVIDLRASQLDPVDTRGIPGIDHETKLADWYQFQVFPRIGRNATRGILLLEEFNSAVPAVQATFYQLLFDRRIGDYVLPPEWVVWALGNQAEDNGVTHDVAGPNANRFIGHVVSNPTVNDFMDFGIENGIREEVLCFLLWRPQLLFSYDSNATNMTFGSMRTWHYVSDLMNSYEETIGEIDLNRPDELFIKSVKACVGEGEGTEFIGYLDYHGKTPNIDHLLGDPENSEIPSSIQICWAVVGGIVNKFKNNKALAPRILAYACRLKAEFATILVKQCLEMDSEFAEHPEFMSFTNKHGRLI